MTAPVPIAAGAWAFIVSPCSVDWVETHIRDHSFCVGVDPLARYEPLIDDYEAFRAACDRPLPTTVRVNDIKASRGRESSLDRIRQAYNAEGISVTQTDWNDQLLHLDTETAGKTWPYVLGWVHGQEAVSTIPPRVLTPEPGEIVWDACAAPGSKTTQMAARMGDRGLLVANDSNLGRLTALRSNTDRLGITNVAVTNADGTTYSLKQWGFDSFDRALVDVPCSCEGTVRKHPAAIENWSKAQLTGHASLQRRLLRRAIAATKPGGIVVYSTCTFAPEENEAVVDDAIETGNCQIIPYDLQLESTPGITEWADETYDESVRHAHRIFPHQNDTGGFFCAKIKVAE